MILLLIFLGAGLGSLARYGIVNACCHYLGFSFPYGTLVVNITGSLIMGLLSTLLLDKYQAASPELSALLMVGFLGGYTTFSSFAIETLVLYQGPMWFKALINIATNVVFSLVGVSLGVLTAKKIVGAD